MDIITIDWETFYDPANKYSLQCSGVTTESYVTDPRFEEILVSAKRNGCRTEWFSGDRDELGDWLQQWDLPNNALLAQNTRFDGLILAHHYGIIPRFYFDTLGMARALLKYKLPRIGLRYLAEYFGLPAKGDEVDNVMGLRRADFSPARLERYAEYCCHDTDLTWEIFNRLKADFPRSEYEAIDDQLRMYLVPQLELDERVFATAVKRCELRKQQVWDELEVQGVTKAMLSSNKQFAELLRSRGVEPPLKESPSWLKKPEEERDPEKQWIYALGKADPAFIELREQFAGDEEMSAILDARVEAKSTIEQTRAEKYRQLAQRSRSFRIPTQYCGAHTGRPTGDEGLNVLNLSNPRPIKGKIDPIDGGPLLQSYLRFGVVAPEGYDIIAADLSQIEARFVSVLSGQDDLVQAFAAGQCVYSLFATDLFGRPVSKALAKVDPQAEKDRQSGKVTILGCGYGMGPDKFRASSRSQGLNLSEEEAKRFVMFYRERYPMIKAQWAIYDDILRRLGPGGEDSIDCGPVRFFWKDETTVAIELPNGFLLNYPNFKWGRKKKAGMEGTIQFTYQNAGDKYPRNLWGGVVMENLCQSLSYIVIKTISSDIKHTLGIRRALDVYDELIYAIPQEATAQFVVDIDPIFTTKPEWCPDLPLAYEAKIGTSAIRKVTLEEQIKVLAAGRKLPIEVKAGRSYGHV